MLTQNKTPTPTKIVTIFFIIITLLLVFGCGTRKTQHQKEVTNLYNEITNWFFSLNIEEHASTAGYSIPAQILDKIAEENDVIFVISAGNTHPMDMRKEWPSDNFDALKYYII